jgi:hypothetical protein
MLKLGTFLRLRPLEQKHKLKEDYFAIQVGNETYEQMNWSHMAKSSKSVISIHDPLKRSKDQFDFKFDRIYTQEVTNVTFANVILILSIGCSVQEKCIIRDRLCFE